jgi:glycosyltransferase involved in cell wall biosynthesis
VVNFDAELAGRQRDRSLAHRLVTSPGRQVNVFCVNADMLGVTMRGVGARATDSRYNIVRPFWELPSINPDWQAALGRVDEIWAPTAFVGEAFAAATSVPVVHIPVAVTVPRDLPPDRQRFGIAEGATAFLFAFDFASYPMRKNPEAVLAAFMRAFAEDRAQRVNLVIKTMGNSEQKQVVLASIRQMAAADERLIVIDEVLSRAEMHTLTTSSDVFVSLHRSEGFGLGIAEAMAMGKAVIATDYSGSRDFVGHATGFPVPYTLREIQPADYPHYVAGQHWAEPDIEAAAAIMLRLAEDADLRLRTGAARTFMDEFHSPAAVGRLVEARLERIGARRGARV